MADGERNQKYNWWLDGYREDKEPPKETWGDIVDGIQAVRTNNNVLWMEILRTAMKYAPKQTRGILAEIRKNDMLISDLTKELSNDPGAEKT